MADQSASFKPISTILSSESRWVLPKQKLKNSKSKSEIPYESEDTRFKVF